MSRTQRIGKKAGWASVVVLLLTALLVVLSGRGLDTPFCFALVVPVLGAVNMAYALGYMTTATASGALLRLSPPCVAVW